MYEKYRKYWNDALVADVRLSGRIKDTDPPGEGSVDLEVIGYDSSILHCFMDNDDASIFYRNKLGVGNRINTMLFLFGDPTKILPLEKKAKELTWVEKAESFSNYYVSKGEIINIYPESNMMVIDCGVYILTDVTNVVNLRVGDYVQLEGRLDARIIGKVGGGGKDGG